MTMREALLAMGYREQEAGKWLKPFGYQLFGYYEPKLRWTNWLKGANGKILVYESHVYTSGEPLKVLKEWETFTRTDMYCNGDSEFHLTGFDL